MHVAQTFALERGTAVRSVQGATLPGAGEMRALRERIDLLLPADRLLVELAMSGVASRRRIAELLNVPAGTVSRRIARLSARLHDPIVIRLMNPRCGLGAEERQIGVEHFLTGLSAVELARKHQISASQVRGMLKFLRGWHRGVSSAGRLRAED